MRTASDAACPGGTRLSARRALGYGRGAVRDSASACFRMGADGL